jgi:hypothetical protein
LQASLNDSSAYLLNQLKFIQCAPAADKPVDLGLTLCQVFQYLHSYRMVNQIDCIGTGHYPPIHEPTFIIQLSAGGPLYETTMDGSAESFLASQLNIRGLQGAGCSYFREPFRWDQRLFTLFLKPAKAAQEWLDHCASSKPPEQFLNRIGVGYCPMPNVGVGEAFPVQQNQTIEYWMSRMAEVTLGKFYFAFECFVCYSNTAR